MSTLQSNQPTWPLANASHDPKYEKCLNITEEIYKRINITFEIKKLETESQSDVSNNSEQIDSNDLSNETDLFAYDKSSSISSSVSDVTAQRSSDKFINLNNNEESKFKKTVPFLTTPRPRKRFRKRVKKRQTKTNRSDTDCSSDEGVPLSRIVVDLNTNKSGVEVDKNISPKASRILNQEPKAVGSIEGKESTINDSLNITIESNCEQKGDSDKKPSKGKEQGSETLVINQDKQRFASTEKELLDQNVDNAVNNAKDVEKGQSIRLYMCPICNVSFRGNRGLKRHMTMSHISSEECSKTSPPAKGP